MVTPIKVKRSRKIKKDATSIQMLVESNSDSAYDVFDCQVIINSLKKELSMTDEDALSIAKKVEEHLLKANFKEVTSSFIRSLVNQILTDYGYDQWLKYSSLSIPVFDVKQLIEEHNSENSNTAFSPESINLTISGQILKQYALREVFTKEVASAHIKGDLHLHDLDFINRSYCSGNNIEYIKLHGLKLNGIMTHSSPARHAQTLVNHLSCFTNYLQCYFAGAIGWDAVNMFFAPFFFNKEPEYIKQAAQHLIYSFAQLAGARGGQTAFVDFNMYLHIPEHYKNTPVVIPGGSYNGRTYKDYEEESRLFFEAILDVLMEGDSNGGNFAFPKILLHITDEDKNDPLMDKVAAINSKRGAVYILYDRGTSVKVSQCCRLNLTLTQEEVERMMQHPEEMRFSAWQNITIPLPRIAYKYKKLPQIHKEIDRLLRLCMEGHISKRNYIKQLLASGKNGCLNFLATGMDGKPYLRENEAKFLIGMLGLNEMVQVLTGEQLHESEKALMLGLNIIAYMYKSMTKLAEEYGISCLLEETPAEGLSLRAALLDLKQFPDEAPKYVHGDIESKQVYYTNSVHLAYNANVDILTRIDKQSKFAPMIQAGSIIHNWFGEHEPDPKALKELYFNVLAHTNAVQTADSPDMTVCSTCNTMTKGLHDVCPKCSSDNVYQLTRITGYFSKISGWTKSKLAELKDRVRVDFTMPNLPSTDNNEERVLFFSKPNCEKCDFVKKQLLASEHIGKINIVDTQTYDGYALACYYNVNLLPTIMKVHGKNVISKLEQVGSFLKWIKDNLS